MARINPNYHPTASASFTIEIPGCINPILGEVATSGISADPYRGELLGIYAILSVISYIEQFNRNFTSGKFKVGCDNEKTGWISGLSHPTVAFQTKHLDLVKAIRRLRLSLKTTISFYHIYGHQDKHTPAHLLPRDTQLNIIVDNIAQHKFDTAHEHFSFISNAKFFHEGWSIEIGGVKLQDKLASHIRQWIGKKALRQYLYDKDLVVWTVFPVYKL